MTQIRKPAVAGHFYPADADDLRFALRSMLGQISPVPAPPPKALIVPHAGYIYSGPVAAAAYARLAQHGDLYKRVVLLGPCHRVATEGIAASTAIAFRTPLGDIPLTRESGVHPEVKPFDEAHMLEHSLEVQLPFLQTVLAEFSLLPLAVGAVSPETVSEVIDLLWDGPETLLVVSTDLSHFLPYEEAVSMDRLTCGAIDRMESESIGHASACGATPLCGLLLSARRHGMRIETLEMKNSGDIAGNHSQVVGYGAWQLQEEELCERVA